MESSHLINLQKQFTKMSSKYRVQIIRLPEEDSKWFSYSKSEMLLNLELPPLLLKQLIMVIVSCILEKETIVTLSDSELKE